MRKGLAVVLTVVVVLAVLFLVTPFGMGFMVKDRVSALVQRSSSSPNVQLLLEDYHRGWFSSTAKVIMKITPLIPAMPGVSGQDNSYQFVMNANIKHGPLLIENKANGGHGVRLGQALIDTNIQVTPEQQAIIDKFFDKSGQKPSVVIHTLITLMGAIDTILGIPEFSFSNSNLQTNLQWKGLNGEWSVSRNLKHVSGNIMFGGLSFSSPIVDLMSGTATVDYKERRADNGLWVGNGVFSLPKLMIKQNKEGHQFELTGTLLNSESSESDNLISSSTDLQFQKMIINQTTYGPAEYKATLKNIDAKVLAKITDQIRQFSGKESDPSQKQVMLMFLTSQIPLLLDKGAEFQIQKLNFTMPEGTMSADANIKFSKEDTVKGGVWQRLDAIANLQASVDLVKKWITQLFASKYSQQLLTQQPGAMTPDQVNQAAVQASDKQIQAWIDKGLLVLDKDYYKIALTYKAGQLTVNGKSMNNNAEQQPATATQPSEGTAPSTQQPGAQAPANPSQPQITVPGMNQPSQPGSQPQQNNAGAPGASNQQQTQSQTVTTGQEPAASVSEPKTSSAADHLDLSEMIG